MTSSSITKNQDGVGVGIEMLSLMLPPQAQTITSKVRGSVTRAERDKSKVMGQIVNAMWNHLAVCETGKIMIVSLNIVLCVDVSRPIEMT